MQPLVSFVVPCYQLGHLLAQCVNSVLMQDYSNFEVLIMDNCSPDETPQVAQSFKDPRVRHIRNESNLGHVPNFNKGFTLASGKYVWVLSADDVLRDPHVVSRYVELMEREPEVGFVYCRAMELHGAAETGLAKWTDAGEQDQVWHDQSFFMGLLDFNRIAMSSVMMRKKCLDKVGLLQLDLPFACDWHMWCMFALYYPVAYFAEPMVGNRFHEKSLTTQYSHDHARICIADELTVLWRVSREAEGAGLSSSRLACIAALVQRSVCRLKAGLDGETPCLTRAEFEDILQTRIRDQRGVREIRAAVYTGLADQQYSGQQYTQAAQSYRLGLAARPGRLLTWTKYLLLRTGPIGIRILHLAD